MEGLLQTQTPTKSCYTTYPGGPIGVVCCSALSNPIFVSSWRKTQLTFLGTWLKVWVAFSLITCPLVHCLPYASSIAITKLSVGIKIRWLHTIYFSKTILIGKAKLCKNKIIWQWLSSEIALWQTVTSPLFLRLTLMIPFLCNFLQNHPGFLKTKLSLLTKGWYIH